MKKMFMGLLIAAAFMACNNKESKIAKVRAQEWQLESFTVNDSLINNPVKIPVIHFTDSTSVYGSAGCNRFGGAYEISEEGTVTIKPGGVTMMYCPDMPFEDKYLHALELITNYTVGDEELKLTGRNNQITIKYRPNRNN